MCQKRPWNLVVIGASSRMQIVIGASLRMQIVIGASSRM